MCERELETEQRLQHIDPTLMAITAFFSRSPGLLNWGAWGPSLSGTWSSFQHLLSNSSEALNSNCSIRGPEGPLCWVLVLSTTSYLQLTRISCAPSYIIVLFMPTQFNLLTVKVIPLITSTGCTCYLHRCISYFDSSVGINM